MGDDTTGEDAEPVDRVRLNLRVDEDVKDAFEKAIYDKHRAKAPYCGFVLERECRFHLDDSILNDLWDNVDALADEFGQRDRKEKISRPERGETSIVQYAIAEDVREAIKKFAEATHYRSGGEFIESIMWRFANGRGREEHLVDRTDRILQAAKNEHDDALSAIERRTKRVAETVAADGSGFDIDEFDAALDDARGINATNYARKKYLPRVLDELGYTWTGSDTDVFVDAEDIDTEGRDPREKPYLLMDDDDRHIAIKYELWTRAGRTSGDRALVELDDVLDTLQGRPQRTTAKRDMRTIGDEPGFQYVEAAARTSPDAGDGLEIHPGRVADTPAHSDLMDLVTTDDETAEKGSSDLKNASTETVSETPETPTDTAVPTADGGEPDDDPADATTWVDAVAGDVIDVPFDAMDDEQVKTILRGQIAKKKYADPGDIDDETGSIHTGGRLDELEAKVTDDDLDAVRRELGLTTTDDPDEIADEVDDEFAALEAADRARADGGRPVK